jgi:hypothetical protein
VLLFPQVLLSAATSQQLNQNLRSLYILFKFIEFKTLLIDDWLNIIGHNGSILKPLVVVTEYFTVGPPTISSIAACCLQGHP